MAELPLDPQRHFSDRIGWLRAAVLGANDGIISTSSLLIGVAAADGGRSAILIAGVVGLVAGAMSMAAGEYVSVSSQADTEKADLNREREHLAADPEFEQQELADLYVARGLEPGLALEVAGQLMRHDALGAHAREELGLSEVLAARPIQAALASAASFALGAGLPLITVVLAPHHVIMQAVAGSSLFFLASVGGMAGWAGGSSVAVSALRVTLWGALAMALTAGIGHLFGTVV